MGPTVALDPTGKFAYVSNQGGSVSAYSIRADGSLTPVPGSPFAAGSGPFSVVVDPTGKFVYVANVSGNNVSAYSIGANGALTPVAGSPFERGKTPYSVALDPTGKTSLRGKPTATPSRPTVSGPMDPSRSSQGRPSQRGHTPGLSGRGFNGKFAYVANASGNNVSAYSIGADGSLTQLPGSPFAAGNGSFSVAVDPRASSPTWQTGS